MTLNLNRLFACGSLKFECLFTASFYGEDREHPDPSSRSLTRKTFLWELWTFCLESMHLIIHHLFRGIKMGSRKAINSIIIVMDGSYVPAIYEISSFYLGFCCFSLLLHVLLYCCCWHLSLRKEIFKVNASLSFLPLKICWKLDYLTCVNSIKH